MSSHTAEGEWTDAGAPVLYLRWCGEWFRRDYPATHARHADAAGACLLCGGLLVDHVEWYEFSIGFVANYGPRAGREVARLQQSRQPHDTTGNTPGHTPAPPVILLLPGHLVMCDGRRVELEG